MIRSITMALLVAVLTVPAFAVEPGEMLKDPALEARARELSKEIRCLVCQNQSIDDSNAGLAKDLRVILRERLVAGDSDSDIKTFLVERYGVRHWRPGRHRCGRVSVTAAGWQCR